MKSSRENWGWGRGGESGSSGSDFTPQPSPGGPGAERGMAEIRRVGGYSFEQNSGGF